MSKLATSKVSFSIGLGGKNKRKSVRVYDERKIGKEEKNAIFKILYGFILFNVL